MDETLKYIQQPLPPSSNHPSSPPPSAISGRKESRTCRWIYILTRLLVKADKFKKSLLRSGSFLCFNTLKAAFFNISLILYLNLTHRLNLSLFKCSEPISIKVFTNIICLQLGIDPGCSNGMQILMSSTEVDVATPPWPPHPTFCLTTVHKGHITSQPDDQTAFCFLFIRQCDTFMWPTYPYSTVQQQRLLEELNVRHVDQKNMLICYFCKLQRHVQLCPRLPTDQKPSESHRGNN